MRRNIIYLYIYIYLYIIHISPLAKAKCSFPAGAGYWRDKPHPTSQSLPFSWCSEGPWRPACWQMFSKTSQKLLAIWTIIQGCFSPHPTSQSLPFSWGLEGPSRPAWRQMFCFYEPKTACNLNHHSGRLLKINNHFQLQNNTHFSFEKWFLLPPNSYLKMPLNFRCRPLSPSKSRPIYSKWLKKLIDVISFQKKNWRSLRKKIGHF